MQRPGLHLAQRCSLRVGGDGVPGDVSRCGRLGAGGPAALHDRCLLRQEAPRAQDGEQEAAQAQVRRPQFCSVFTRSWRKGKTSEHAYISDEEI